MFAETELSPASFLALLHVRTQVTPALIILGSQLLDREGLLFADHGSHDTNRTPYHDTSNRSTSARGSSLMDPCDAKAMFQIIVGARQSLYIIAMKEPRRKVGGLVAKMLNGLAQRPYVGFLHLHLANVCQVAFTNLYAGMLLIIRQDLCRLVHQSIRALQWRPQRSGGFHSFGQKLLQQLESRWQPFFSWTRAIESLTWVIRSYNRSPDACRGERPSSVKEARTARQ